MKEVRRGLDVHPRELPQAGKFGDGPRELIEPQVPSTTSQRNAFKSFSDLQLGQVGERRPVGDAPLQFVVFQVPELPVSS
jgi:hypothetical protein